MTTALSDKRLVGVKSRYYTHAVMVPHDLPLPEEKVIFRRGRGGLYLHGQWSGMAECGLVVRGVVAGAKHGHDWVLVSDKERCYKCVRAINKEKSGSI